MKGILTDRRFVAVEKPGPTARGKTLLLAIFSPKRILFQLPLGEIAAIRHHIGSGPPRSRWSEVFTLPRNAQVPPDP